MDDLNSPFSKTTYTKRKKRKPVALPPIKKSEFYNKILQGPEDQDASSFEN